MQGVIKGISVQAKGNIYKSSLDISSNWEDIRCQRKLYDDSVNLKLTDKMKQQYNFGQAVFAPTHKGRLHNCN